MTGRETGDRAAAVYGVELCLRVAAGCDIDLERPRHDADVVGRVDERARAYGRIAGEVGIARSGACVEPVRAHERLAVGRRARAGLDLRRVRRRECPGDSPRALGIAAEPMADGKAGRHERHEGGRGEYKSPFHESSLPAGLSGHKIPGPCTVLRMFG